MRAPADYYITGVWFDAFGQSDAISQIYLHRQHNNAFLPGVKTGLEELQQLIRSGRVIRTLVWNPLNLCWTIGAAVTTEVRQGNTYLRLRRGTDRMLPADTAISISLVHD